MKTVKLSEVGKKGWRISPADRLNINSIETSKQVTGAMEKISQAMQTNIDVLAKLAKKLDVVSIETGKAQPAIAPAARSWPRMIEASCRACPCSSSAAPRPALKRGESSRIVSAATIAGKGRAK